MALKLTSITGWQYDRRRALALLNSLGDRAMKRGDDVTREALWSAAYDVEWTLRERAASEITECVRMAYAHLQPAQQVAA